MNKKNILLAAAVLVAGQTYGSQPDTILSTVSRPSDTSASVSPLYSYGIGRSTNELAPLSILFNACGSACRPIINNAVETTGFYAYHILKYPCMSAGFTALVGKPLTKFLGGYAPDHGKLLYAGAALGLVGTYYFTKEDIRKAERFGGFESIYGPLSQANENLQVVQGQLRDQATALQNLQAEQQQTTTAIETAARQLGTVRNQLQVNSTQLSTLEQNSLGLMEEQFILALQGLLNSSIGLQNTYIAIHGLPENHSIRNNSIQMFAGNLLALNGLAGRAQHTLKELKRLYPDLYAQLEASNINLTITVPLTSNLALLNESAKTFPALDQVPVVQQALENRVERDAQLMSLASSSSSVTTSSSRTNTAFTAPVIANNVTSITRNSYSFMTNSNQLQPSIRPASSVQRVPNVDDID